MAKSPKEVFFIGFEREAPMRKRLTDLWSVNGGQRKPANDYPLVSFWGRCFYKSKPTSTVKISVFGTLALYSSGKWGLIQINWGTLNFKSLNFLELTYILKIVKSNKLSMFCGCHGPYSLRTLKWCWVAKRSSAPFMTRTRRRAQQRPRLRPLPD